MFSGTLLMEGAPWLIVLDCATAVAGVCGAAARLYHGAAGLCLILPAGAFAGARWFNLAGAAMALLLYFFERRRASARPLENVVRP